MNGIGNYIIGSSISLIIMIVLILIIYYILTRRSMKKQQKHFVNIHETINTGCKVRTHSGIIGKVLRVGKETIDIEIKSGGVIEISRFAVEEIL